MLRFGLVKTSFIDYPGLIAATLFTCGCNLRCPYCHNPELVLGEADEEMMGADEVLRFLSLRRNVLDGVCITGGEPLLHPGLEGFIHEVRGIGYKIKIDTNGSLPEVLETLKPDYIALDIKTLPEKYGFLLGPAVADYPGTAARIAGAVRASAAYVIGCGIDHELRSTAAPGIFVEEDIPLLAELVRGARRYILTAMRPRLTLDPAYSAAHSPYPEETLLRMRQIFRDRGVNCFLRGEPEGP